MNYVILRNSQALIFSVFLVFSIVAMTTKVSQDSEPEVDERIVGEWAVVSFAFYREGVGPPTEYGTSNSNKKRALKRKGGDVLVQDDFMFTKMVFESSGKLRTDKDRNQLDYDVTKVGTVRRIKITTPDNPNEFLLGIYMLDDDMLLMLLVKNQSEIPENFVLANYKKSGRLIQLVRDNQKRDKQ